MAKRMDPDQEMYRVGVEVSYTIRYHSYNPNWDHEKPTTGDHEGDNPMYVWHDSDTDEHFFVYLGPFGTKAMAEKQCEKFIAHYEESPESYRHLKITAHPVEKAVWEVAY